MFEHIDRHANEITFVKYQYRSCCEEWKSPRLKYFLSKFGLKLFAPSTTVTLRHYDTFLQSRLKKESVYSGSGQPSCETNYLGLCNFCPSYRFKSKSGKNCHMSVFHHRQNAQPNPKKFIYIWYLSHKLFQPFKSKSSYERKHTKRDQGEKRKTLNENQLLNENAEWNVLRFVKEEQNKTMNNQWNAQSHQNSEPEH